MTIRKRILLPVLVVPLLAVVASCVESRHPLSDEKTSTIDERLIGTWRCEDDKELWQVKRSADVKNALAATVTEGDTTSASILFTTTIKSKGYMSIKDSDEGSQKKPPPARYDIYQYVFLDNDTVQVRGMEPKVIAKAIAGKRLGGEIEVKREVARPILGLFGKPKVVETETPVITDSRKGIAGYLEANADQCYPAEAESMLTFRRQK